MKFDNLRIGDEVFLAIKDQWGQYFETRRGVVQDVEEDFVTVNDFTGLAPKRFRKDGIADSEEKTKMLPLNDRNAAQACIDSTLREAAISTLGSVIVRLRNWAMTSQEIQAASIGARELSNTISFASPPNLNACSLGEVKTVSRDTLTEMLGISSNVLSRITPKTMKEGVKVSGYTSTDVFILFVANSLREAGMSLEGARSVAKTLELKLPDKDEGYLDYLRQFRHVRHLLDNGSFITIDLISYHVQFLTRFKINRVLEVSATKPPKTSMQKCGLDYTPGEKWR